eukprot:4702447-Prymnesium_polylepis.1
MMRGPHRCASGCARRAVFARDRDWRTHRDWPPLQFCAHLARRRRTPMMSESLTGRTSRPSPLGGTTRMTGGVGSEAGVFHKALRKSLSAITLTSAITSEFILEYPQNAYLTVASSEKP